MNKQPDMTFDVKKEDGNKWKRRIILYVESTTDFRYFKEEDGSCRN